MTLRRVSSIVAVFIILFTANIVPAKAALVESAYEVSLNYPGDNFSGFFDFVPATAISNVFQYSLSGDFYLTPDGASYKVDELIDNAGFPLSMSSPHQYEFGSFKYTTILSINDANLPYLTLADFPGATGGTVTLAYYNFLPVPPASTVPLPPTSPMFATALLGFMGLAPWRSWRAARV
jgi:hypothetical protein